MDTFTENAVIKIQSISDIITNSSSEVFICDYDAPIPHGESWSYLIDREFLLERNEDDAFFVWKYLKDKFGLDNPIEDHRIDPHKPDEIEFIWSSYLERFKEKHGDPKPNKYYMEVLDKFIEDHKEVQDLLDDNHWLVNISDHDYDYEDYEPYGILIYD